MLNSIGRMQKFTKGMISPPRSTIFSTANI